MATDQIEPAEKVSCDSHPGRTAVARCDRCGRALCLVCAVPVRGRALGAECLRYVLGPEDAAGIMPEPRPHLRNLWVAAGGFVVGVLATILPWTRFGTASGLFGGWAVPPRWSVLAAGSAVLGAGLAAVLLGRGTDPGRIGWWVLAWLAAMMATGAMLHVLRPPPFTHAWMGPWVALVGGLVALAETLFTLRPVSARLSKGDHS